MRILRNLPPQILPLLQNRNVWIPRIVANRYGHSPHLPLQRQRVLFSIRFHRKTSYIRARPVRPKRIRKNAPILRRRPKTPSRLHPSRLHRTSRNRPAPAASPPPHASCTLCTSKTINSSKSNTGEAY